MPRVTKKTTFVVPYGVTDELTLYIDGTEYPEFNYIKAVKKLNQVSLFELELEDVDDSDTKVKKNKVVLIFTNNKLFLKGIITNVKNITDGITKVTGYGSGEYKLLRKTVTRNVTDESVFVNKDSTDIVTNTCSSVISIGTNTNLGKLSIRAEYDNKLKLLSNTAHELNGDWWCDTTDATYTTDQFNMSTSRGSASSVYTHNYDGVDQNTEEVSREEDYDTLWNSITCLGFGDGVHQITSKINHATVKRTTLDGTITSSATTIDFVDGSVFSNGDIIWIGMEKVTLGTVTANQATGCTRGITGNGAIDAYSHNDGISSYLYTRGATTYDDDNGESGSSLDDNELNQKVIQDKTITDQNALDLVAQRILDDHKDLVVRITCTVNDLYDYLDDADLGDVVTLNDSDIGLVSAEYRVVGLELISDDSFEELNIEISNRYTTMTENIKGTQVDTDNLSRYMQGASNVISVQSYENAAYTADPDVDDSNAMRMRFRIWDKTIAIKEAILDFKISKFRAYTDSSQTASGGGSHNHSLSGVTTNSNGEGGDDDYASSGITNSTLTTAGTWYSLMNYTRDSTDQTNQFFTATIRCKSTGKNQIYWFKVVNNTTGAVYPDSSVFPTITLQGIDSIASVSINTFSNNSGDELQLLIAAQTYNSTNIEWNATRQAEGTHTHGYTAQTTSTELAHEHSITMAHGIYRHTKTPTVKVQIGIDDDWAATKSYLNSGAAYSYGTPSPIDFTTKLKELVGNLTATKRIRIQFEPQGATETCRIEANADIFTHLSSD